MKKEIKQLKSLLQIASDLCVKIEENTNEAKRNSEEINEKINNIFNWVEDALEEIENLYFLSFFS